VADRKSPSRVSLEYQSCNATDAAGLKAFVDVNPISILATASRGLMDGTAEAGDIAVVLATAALLTAVFAPLTTRLYRRG
jgi:ABC-2 type transport system permease protein